MQGDAENELEELQPDTWAPLAAANTKILRTIFPLALRADQDSKCDKTGRATQKDEDRDAEYRYAVEYRLREYRAFELRASGAVIKPRIGI
jgi:hypothetical protein